MFIGYIRKSPFLDSLLHCGPRAGTYSDETARCEPLAGLLHHHASAGAAVLRGPKSHINMGVSKNEGPQNGPQYSMILILGTPKKGPQTFGNPRRDSTNHGF